jgi:hypothetical protein
MFGLKATALLGIACAALTVLLFAAGIVIWNQWDTISAKDERIKEIAQDRDAQADGLATAKAALKRQQDRMDENDAVARTSLQKQQANAHALAVKLRDATDQKHAVLAQLQEEINARPETVVVSVSVPDGWDPAIVVGMRRLKCVQLTAAGNPDAADCRVSGTAGAGRSGLVGDPTGAPYPRPTARQQLDFLAFAWSLREWGASCYDDKRAIAESQP